MVRTERSTTTIPWYAPEQFFDLSSFAHAAIFKDISCIWQALERLEAYILGQSLGKNESREQHFAYLVNPEHISIGEGSVIEPGAYIRGPAIIGKNCQIRHGSYIRGNVVVGDRCVVGHATELKHCILLDDAKAAHFAFVGDSILGNRVNLGAGVKCANLRLDHQEIVLRNGSEEIPSGMRKLGAILGDSVDVGCNSVLNPGTLIGRGSLCYPMMTLSGVIPSGKVLRPSTKNIRVDERFVDK